MSRRISPWVLSPNFLFFVGKSAQKNPPRKSSARSIKQKSPTHSAEGPGQKFCWYFGSRLSCESQSSHVGVHSFDEVYSYATTQAQCAILRNTDTEESGCQSCSSQKKRVCAKYAFPNAKCAALCDLGMNGQLNGQISSSVNTVGNCTTMHLL